MTLTPTVILILTCMVFWIGRMSKTNPTIEYVDREKVVEKRVEVPTTVYKCHTNCITNLALELYNQTDVNEWSPDSADEEMDMQEARNARMQECVDMAIKIHASQKQGDK